MGDSARVERSLRVVMVVEGATASLGLAGVAEATERESMVVAAGGAGRGAAVGLEDCEIGARAGVPVMPLRRPRVRRRVSRGDLARVVFEASGEGGDTSSIWRG